MTVINANEHDIGNHATAATVAAAAGMLLPSPFLSAVSAETGAPGAAAAAASVMT